jgi:hypothetical protein
MSSELEEIKSWLLEQLPSSVLASEPEITIEGDELLVILHVAADSASSGDGTREQSERALIERLRTETRALRVHLGRSINRTYGLVVSWGMQAGETVQMFTNNNAVPVMTRLTRQERQVLDTLIAANIANTRSTALSYIVRTFAAEHRDWLNEIQEVAKHMARLRKQVPLLNNETAEKQVSDQEKSIHQEE